ncbi:MAG: helix-turn-helix transcriptional regulator [Firmicutes bacterium]|nr:helix-turn-helix transcriptional regulator [Bacillota bacterium]
MFTNEEIKATVYSLLRDRGWSANRLATESNLPQSTINSMLHGNKEYYPSVPTLSKICDALGITVSDFLRMVEDDERPELTPEEYRIIRAVQKLSWEERKHLLDFLEALNSSDVKKD